jgi:hypothetical protein
MNAQSCTSPHWLLCMVKYSTEQRGKFTFTFHCTVLYETEQLFGLSDFIFLFKRSRRNFMASCNNVVSMETMLWAGYPSNHGPIPDRTERFIFSPDHSDQLCGPSSLLFNWDQGTLSPCVKLITHSKTVARFRMCWAGYLSLPHKPSWCLQGQPYLYIGRII